MQCPGSRGMRHPVPEMIECPSCGKEVEIWSDEISIQCRYCSHTISRREKPACFDWCKMAKECAGEEIYNNFKKNRAITLKDKLRKGYKTEEEGHSFEKEHMDIVLQYAEQISENENGDWHIVIPACIINEMNFNRIDEEVNEGEAPILLNRRVNIIKSLILSNNFSIEDTNEICDIIYCWNSDSESSNQNFNILHDSLELAALHGGNRKKEISSNRCDDITKTFRTATGRKLAEEIYMAVCERKTV